MLKKLLIVTFLFLFLTSTTGKVAAFSFDPFDKYGKFLPWLTNPSWRDNQQMVITSTPNGHLSNFGYRAVDFARNGGDAATIGIPVLAISDGVVEKVGNDPQGWGNYVILDHQNGYKTRYAHLGLVVLNSSDVGHAIRRGQEIGEFGNTGRVTSANLELEMMNSANGAIDPIADGRAFQGFISNSQVSVSWQSPITSFNHDHAFVKSTNDVRPNDPGNPWDPPVIDPLDRYLQNYGYLFPSGMVAEPINTALGSFLHRSNDLEFNNPSGPEFKFERVSNSPDQFIGFNGLGWTNTFNIKVLANPDNTFSVKFEDGRGESFKEVDTDPNTYTRDFQKLTAESLGTLVRLDASNNYRFQYTSGDKTIYLFNSDKGSLAWGKIEKITSVDGKSINFIYDSNGNLQKASDSFGNWMTLSFGQDKLLDTLTGSDGSVINYSYNFDGRLTSVTKNNGGAWTYAYDSQGRITTIIDAEGKTVVAKNTYDSAGRVIEQIDGNGGTTKLEYTSDASNNKSTKITDPLGNVTVQLHNANNYLTEEDRADGTSIKKEYNAQGKVTKETNESAVATLYEYDANGNTTKETHADGYIKETKYSSQNLPIEIKDPSGIISMEYNNAGRKTKVTDQLGSVSTYLYDANNNLIKEINNNGNAKVYAYNANGHLVEQSDFSTSSDLKYEYDARGNQTKVTDALNNVSTFTYDGRNHLVKSTDSRGSVKTYAYDRNGNLASETDEAGAVKTYRSDNNENIVEIAYPSQYLQYPTKQVGILNNSNTLIDEKFNTNLSRWDVSNSNVQIIGKTLLTKNKTTDSKIYSVWLEPKLDQEYWLSALYKTANATAPQFNIEMYDANFNFVRNAKPLGLTWNGGTFDGWDNEYRNAFYFPEDLWKGSQVSIIKYARLIITLPAGSNGTEGTTILDDIYLGHLNRPIAKIINYKGGWLGEKMILDATGSWDFETNIKKAYWTEITGPEVSINEESNKLMSSFVIPALDKDTAFTFRLIVEDGNGVRSIARTKTLVIKKNTLLPTELNNVSNEVQDDFIDPNDPTSQIDTSSPPILVNVTEQFEYDKNNNRIKYKDKNGNITRYTYNNRNELIKTDSYGAGVSILSSQIFAYDKVGNIIKKTDLTSPGINQDGNITRFIYDSLNRITETINPDGKSQKIKYDILGRVIEKTDLEGNVTKYEYDALGRNTKMIDSSNAATIYSYDRVGNMIKKIDTLGNATIYAYDSSGRTSGVRNAIGDVANYVYDSVGNLIGQRNFAGELTILSYDGNNNLIGQTNTLNLKTNFEYDSRNNLTKITDPNGDYTTYNYDAMGNKVREVDALGQQKNLVYDNNGNLIQFTGENGESIKTSYDGLNRKIAEVDQKGNTVKYQYDSLGNVISQTDKNGNGTSYKYDKNRNVIEIVNALGDSQRIEYSPNGNILKTIDPLGNATTYKYNNLNENIETINPIGGSIKSTFDSLGRLTSKTDLQNKATTYAYDSLGNVIKITDRIGNETSIEYDKVGKVIKVTKPNGAISQSEYDSIGRLAKDINAENGVTTYGYDSASNLISTTLPNNITTSFGYDSLNRKVHESVAGVSKSSEYDSIGRLIKSIDANGNQTSYQYDSVNNIAKVTNPRGFSTNFEYDNNGNLTKVTNAKGTATTFEYNGLNLQTKTTQADGTTLSQVYDKDGRVVKSIDPKGNSIGNSYDALGRIVSNKNQLGNSTSYEFDANGNVVKKTDAEGNLTKYAYDSLDRLVKVTDALNHDTNYEYDNVGNLTKEINANNKSTIRNYNKLNQLKEETDPLGNKVSYSYDLAGDLVSKVKADGTVVGYSYDALNRLNTIGFSDSNQNVNYEYDNAGNITKIQKGNSVVSFIYDENSNLISATQDGNSTVSYSYDELNNQSQIRYPNQTIAEFDYTALNQVKDLSIKKNSAISTTQFGYDANGNLTSQVNPNGSQISKDYDNTNRLTKVSDISITHDSEGVTNTSNIAEFNYSLDKNGNKLSEGFKLGDGAAALVGTKDYNYDSLQRLTKATVTHNSVGQNVVDSIEEFGYDNIGNRVNLKTTNVSSPAESRDAELNYSYNDANQLIEDSANNYSYDANGNRISKTGKDGNKSIQYSYDLADNLTNVQSNISGKNYNISYNYDGLNRRVEKSINSTNSNFYSDVSYIKYAYLGKSFDTISQDVNGTIQNFYRAGISNIEPTLIASDLISPAVKVTDPVVQNDEPEVPASFPVSYPGDEVPSSYPVSYPDDSVTPEQTPVEDTSVNLSYYFRDGLDSVVGVSNKNSTVDYLNEYSSYGKIKDSSKLDVFNSKTYSGQDYDVESEMSYYGSRYYDSEIGSWNKMDSYQGNTSNPSSRNKYAFVENNPVNSVDVDGFAGEQMTGDQAITYLNDQVTQTNTFISQADKAAVDGQNRINDINNSLATLSADATSKYWSAHHALEDEYTYVLMNGVVGRLQARGYSLNYGQVYNYLGNKITEKSYIYAAKQQQYYAAAQLYESSVQERDYLQNDYLPQISSAKIEALKYIDDTNSLKSDVQNQIDQIKADAQNRANAAETQRNISLLFAGAGAVIGGTICAVATAGIATAGCVAGGIALVAGVGSAANSEINRQDAMYTVKTGTFMDSKANFFNNLGFDKTTSSSLSNAINVGGNVAFVVSGVAAVATGVIAGVALLAPVIAGVGTTTAATAATEATATGGTIALGLDELGSSLDKFAEEVQAITYKAFVPAEALATSDWKPYVLEKLADVSTKINFNLTGINSIMNSVSRASAGMGGATDWELLQIYNNPQFWDRVTFFQDGVIVPNPFN